MTRATSPRIVLTRELAFASGADAASAQMRRAGRTTWNAADAALASERTNRLLRHVPFSHGGLAGLPDDVLAELGCAS